MKLVTFGRVEFKKFLYLSHYLHNLYSPVYEQSILIILYASEHAICSF